MASILPNGKCQFIDQNGKPLANGTVTFYVPGTTTLKDTWQDAAMTQPNTNPIVLDSRGQAIIWGGGSYRQVVTDRFGTVIWDQVTSELSQDFQAFKDSLASSTGSTLVGYKRPETGAVQITVNAKLLEAPISPIEFGVVGDGATDDTVAFQDALNAAAGGVLKLSSNKTYAISSISIPANTTILSNGSKFRKLAPSANYAITGGLRLKTDRLWLTSAGAATDNGIYLDGGSMQIGQVRVEFDAPGAGSSAGIYNAAFMVGPDDSTGTSVAQDQIGSVLITNHIYPVIYRNTRQMVAGMHQISSYRRAVYLRNVQDSVFNGASISGTAPGVIGQPGDNGLLMEAYYDGGCTNNVFNGWHVYDSGEHGFRLGGQFPIRNQWFYGCSAIRPGSGSAATGGCGFKAQGSSGTAYHYNINLADFVSEDGQYFGGNGAGIMYSLINGGSISNPTVRKRNNSTYSFWHGLSIDEINNLIISNPKLLDCQQYCFRATANSQAGFPQGMQDVDVRGGIMQSPSNTAYLIAIDSYNDLGVGVPLKRFRISDAKLSGGYQAVKVEPLVTGGSFSDCSMDFTYTDTLGVGGVVQGTDAWLLNMRLDSVNTLITCATGSTQAINGGLIYRKSAGGWMLPNGSYTLNLANNSAFSAAIERTSGMAAVSTTGLAYYGNAFYRTNTPATVKLNGGGNFAVTTGALTGTTGTAGNVTFSVDANNLYVENQSGNTQTIFLTVT